MRMGGSKVYVIPVKNRLCYPHFSFCNQKKISHFFSSLFRSLIRIFVGKMKNEARYAFDHAAP